MLLQNAFTNFMPILYDSIIMLHHYSLTIGLCIMIAYFYYCVKRIEHYVNFGNALYKCHVLLLLLLLLLLF